MTDMPTTQPNPANMWTPGEVIAVLSFFSTVFLASLAAAVVKIIDAAKTARVAIIEAAKASAATHSNTEQLKSLQQQVTSVALSQVPTPQKMSPGLADAVADEMQRRNAPTYPNPSETSA